MEYSFPLALEDFLPVIFSGIGVFLLAQMAMRLDANVGRMALLGAVLVILGGLSKAIWKLLMAMSGGATDIAIMNNALFWLLGPGFALLCYAMSYSGRIATGKNLRRANIWLIPLIAIAVFLTLGAIAALANPTGRTWSIVLLTMTTLGNFGVLLLCIVLSRFLGLRGAMILFIVNLVGILVLTGMQRMPEQTIPLQWTEQLTNTISQGAFAFAAYLLYQKTVGMKVGERAGV